MKQFLHLISCIILATGMLHLSAHADTTPATKAKVPAKKTAKAAEKPAAAPVALDDDDGEPDVQESKTFEYKCELGNVLTMYTNVDDDKHMAMRWKKRLYRLTRMETTTGAHRFENRKAGLLWIGIPAKGLLLDSHRGQQLANECKTTDQIIAEAELKAEAAAHAK
ncbi:hypothetical protein LPB67_06715 [Undibacterium sp. Jales W-56]|uniref:hypothetical protein n=1 Tax=Undibacterium sp. Jales W-56 TaxID=2897325 RepID=UPI0021D35995|nr:hypothetical protein [Undibacterium sp. Jales W-56]MCU6433473.1 hypothetical protein [Undibacterium sp. Jales W-56]